MKKMKKISIMFIAMMMFVTMSIQKTYASDVTFEMDGLTYKIIDEMNVSVVDADKTKTSYDIPQTIVYHDVSYTVVSLGNRLFYEDEKTPAALTSITLPETITTIESGAFQNCQKLTSIRIPNKVKVIESKTFQDCIRLNDVELPNQLTSIKENAFQHCVSLDSLDIPESVKQIANNVFIDCTRLKSIVIPKNIEYLGASAFWYCDNLESITLPNKITKIENNVVKYTSSLSKILVITDTKDEVVNPQLIAALDNKTKKPQIYRGVTSIEAKQTTVDAKRNQTLDLDSYFDKTLEVYDENLQLSSAMDIPLEYQNVEYQLIGPHSDKTQISGNQINIGDDEATFIQIQANLNSHSDILTVNVPTIKITGIELIEKPKKTSYIEGEHFNPDGLIVKIHYNDGSYQIIAYDQDTKTDFSFSQQIPLKPTDNKIMIKYAGYSIELDIEVQTKDIIHVDTEEDKETNQTDSENKPQKEPVNTDTINKTLETGDRTMIFEFTLLMIVSGAIILIIMKKRRMEN